MASQATHVSDSDFLAANELGWSSDDASIDNSGPTDDDCLIPQSNNSVKRKPFCHYGKNRKKSKNNQSSKSKTVNTEEGQRGIRSAANDKDNQAAASSNLLVQEGGYAAQELQPFQPGIDLTMEEYPAILGDSDLVLAANVTEGRPQNASYEAGAEKVQGQTTVAPEYQLGRRNLRERKTPFAPYTEWRRKWKGIGTEDFYSMQEDEEDNTYAPKEQSKRATQPNYGHFSKGHGDGHSDASNDCCASGGGHSEVETVSSDQEHEASDSNEFQLLNPKALRGVLPTSYSKFDRKKLKERRLFEKSRQKRETEKQEQRRHVLKGKSRTRIVPGSAVSTLNQPAFPPPVFTADSEQLASDMEARESDKIDTMPAKRIPRSQPKPTARKRRAAPEQRLGRKKQSNYKPCRNGKGSKKTEKCDSFFVSGFEAGQATKYAKPRRYVPRQWTCNWNSQKESRRKVRVPATRSLNSSVDKKRLRMKDKSSNVKKRQQRRPPPTITYKTAVEQPSGARTFINRQPTDHYPQQLKEPEAEFRSTVFLPDTGTLDNQDIRCYFYPRDNLNLYVPLFDTTSLCHSDLVMSILQRERLDHIPQLEFGSSEIAATSGAGEIFGKLNESIAAVEQNDVDTLVTIFHFVLQLVQSNHFGLVVRSYSVEMARELLNASELLRVTYGVIFLIQVRLVDVHGVDATVLDQAIDKWVEKCYGNGEMLEQFLETAKPCRKTLDALVVVVKLLHKLGAVGKLEMAVTSRVRMGTLLDSDGALKFQIQMIQAFSFVAYSGSVVLNWQELVETIIEACEVRQATQESWSTALDGIRNLVITAHSNVGGSSIIRRLLKFFKNRNLMNVENDTELSLQAPRYIRDPNKCKSFDHQDTVFDRAMKLVISIVKSFGSEELANNEKLLASTLKAEGQKQSSFNQDQQLHLFQNLANDYTINLVALILLPIRATRVRHLARRIDFTHAHVFAVYLSLQAFSLTLHHISQQTVNDESESVSSEMITWLEAIVHTAVKMLNGWSDVPCIGPEAVLEDTLGQINKFLRHGGNALELNPHWLSLAKILVFLFNQRCSVHLKGSLEAVFRSLMVAFKWCLEFEASLDSTSFRGDSLATKVLSRHLNCLKCMQYLQSVLNADLERQEKEQSIQLVASLVALHVKCGQQTLHSILSPWNTDWKFVWGELSIDDNQKQLYEPFFYSQLMKVMAQESSPMDTQTLYDYVVEPFFQGLVQPHPSRYLQGLLLCLKEYQPFAQLHTELQFAHGLPDASARASMVRILKQHKGYDKIVERVIKNQPKDSESNANNAVVQHLTTLPALDLTSAITRGETNVLLEALLESQCYRPFRAEFVQSQLEQAFLSNEMTKRSHPVRQFFYHLFNNLCCQVLPAASSLIQPLLGAANTLLDSVPQGFAPVVQQMVLGSGYYMTRNWGVEGTQGWWDVVALTFTLSLKLEQLVSEERVRLSEEFDGSTSDLVELGACQLQQKAPNGFHFLQPDFQQSASLDALLSNSNAVVSQDSSLSCDSDIQLKAAKESIWKYLRLVSCRNSSIVYQLAGIAPSTGSGETDSLLFGDSIIDSVVL